jgi:hypothetical protein
VKLEQNFRIYSTNFDPLSLVCIQEKRMIYKVQNLSVCEIWLLVEGNNTDRGRSKRK